MKGDATTQSQIHEHFLTTTIILPLSLFSRDILREVKESKGRFLAKDPKTEEWKEVSDKVAQEKVAQVRVISHEVPLVLARHIAF